jgi:recombination protein RecA
MSSEKKKALEMALSQIEKEFGKGAIMKLGSIPSVKIDAIPTGALSLDLALGGGGLPRGRIVEIYGPESSGKSTLAMNVVAQCQKFGGTAAYVDAENAMDAEYAKNIGVNIEELLVSQPDTGEQALDIVETLVRSGAVDIIVVDSVAALVPKAEIEGDMGDQHMGLQARLMSQAMRKLTAIINKSHAVVIFINQIREKIGVMFGSPETTPGGRALKFYASVRIDIRRIETIKKNDVMVGNVVRAKVVKNKIAPPFKESIFDIVFGKGIMRAPATLDAAVNMEVVDKSGTWYTYKETKIGQGKEAAVQYLTEHVELMEEIETRCRDKYFERGEFSKEAAEKAKQEEAKKAAAEAAKAKEEELRLLKAKVIKKEVVIPKEVKETPKHPVN